jgi:prepilin-type N-terminal cleavage/methylation domain-containing protein
MKTHKFRHPLRPGLTLLELVVVLTVLAALAAIVIPMFPNILRRAHKASDATQTQEMSKLVQTYLAFYNGYPNDWDLLTDNKTTTFPDFLPGAKSTAGAFGGFVSAGNLTAAEIGALNAVGITTVQPLATSFAALIPDGDGIKQPTLLPYLKNGIDANRVAIDTSTIFAVLNLTAAQTANPSFLEAVVSASANDATNPSTPRFVVFGVGPRNSMVGKVMQDAPTSVPQNPDLTPANQYARVGVIFMVSGAEVSRTGRARLIAAVAMEDDELELTTKDTVGYYQVAK